jgi:multiple sugar transport system permease protein
VAVTTAPPRRHAHPPAAGSPPTRGRRRAGRATRRERVAGYAFLSPWLLGLALVTTVPFVYSL